MTWEGAAKEVAVGGEFNGWAPVPLACQQVTSNTKKHNYTNIQIQVHSSACLKQAGQEKQGQKLVLSDALAVQSQGLRVSRSKGFKS